MLVQKNKFEVPYYIYKVEDHEDLKSKLIPLLEKIDGINSVQSFETISKSDWNTNQDATYFRKNFVLNKEPNYYSLLEHHIDKIIHEVIPDKNKKSFYVGQGWFHQYKKMNYYFYHWHPGSRWALVYYLELPEDGPKTEFENEFGLPICPDVKEGDILIFPSWIKHRSPPNKSVGRKTIIAFNLVEKESV